MEKVGGSSPGTLAVGVRVRGYDGQPITGKQSCVRTLLRVIHYLPAMCVVAAVLAWLTPRHQGQGDILARTVVVREG